MIPKSKSCPNIYFSYSKNISNSYGTFLRLYPKSTKAERCQAIRYFFVTKR